jgi:pilus assembly protein Flp/PilA
MQTLWSRFTAAIVRARLARTERGASLVEYALLVALIAVICIGAVTLLGQHANSTLTSAASSI